jgi:hypothetical protein
VALPVSLLRRDGFQGDVSLRLLDAPAGMTLGGGVIPAGTDSVRVTLTAPPDALPEPHTLLIEAEAAIGGKSVRHLCVPVDDRTQAFSLHQLVAAQRGLVLVTGKDHHVNPWKVSESRVKIPAGGMVQMRVEAPPGQLKNPLQLQLNDPPQGVEIADVVQEKSWLAVRLRADRKLKDGLKGNLIFDVSMLRPVDPNHPSQNRLVPLGTLPAIPFEVSP